VKALGSSPSTAKKKKKNAKQNSGAHLSYQQKRLKQEDSKFEASLDNIVRFYLTIIII
jgi:hypothetical protein